MVNHPFIRVGLKTILRVSKIDNNSYLLSLNQFSEQYQLKTPFTLYFGFISSIPTQGKSEVVKQKKLCCKLQMTNKSRANTISTKTVYSALLKNVFLPPTVESKILRYGFTHENIHKVYELPYKINNDIKITATRGFSVMVQ